MGIEYRLRFDAPDAAAVAAVLRRVPGASKAHAQEDSIDLVATPFGQPQATVQAEPGGAYFCDHCGGSGRALLGEVVAHLASAFGAVIVEEL